MLFGTVGEICDSQGYVEFDWKIENFSSISQTVGSVYNSPNFEFMGCSWYMQLFPNGRSRKSEGYVSLYLVLGSSSIPIEIRFLVGIKTAKGEKIMWLSSEFFFKRRNHCRGESECILTSELVRRGDELLPMDVLTITTSLMAGSFAIDIKKVAVQTAAEKTVADASIQTIDGKVEHLDKTGVEKVLHDIGKLWISGDNSDVILKVRGVEFKAHRVILSVRAPVLGAMFQHDTTEKASGEVIIDDCDPAVFEQLLHYIYTGAPRELTAENAAALYTVADKYLVDEVKVLCLQCMKDTVCVDNFCDIATLALLHKEQELLETAVEFLSQNVVDVMKTVDWQVFMREYSTSANEMLIRVFEIQAGNGRKNLDVSNM